MLSHWNQADRPPPSFSSPLKPMLLPGVWRKSVSLSAGLPAAARTLRGAPGSDRLGGCEGVDLDRAPVLFERAEGARPLIGLHPPGILALQGRTGLGDRLLELPLHIQDGALFYPNRLDLSEEDADKRCKVMIDAARRTGG